jgi:hypothetical protein
MMSEQDQQHPLSGRSSLALGDVHKSIVMAVRHAVLEKQHTVTGAADGAVVVEGSVRTSAFAASEQ